jgi:adenosylmethionine-8-amino-7-oxononanoate aminotransferase
MSGNARATAIEARPKSYFWHPKAHPLEMLNDPPRKIVRGEGVHVIDGDGVRLLDAVAGLWNVNLGYSAQPIKDAIAKQLELLPYYSSFRGTTNEPAEELARVLIEEWFAPEGMARAFFSSGGSDAVETALRLARQYWKVSGSGERTKFIALRKGYHGTHFGGDSVSGGTLLRRGYEPLLPGCFHIPAPYFYRNQFGVDDQEQLSIACAQALENEILFQGPDTVAAFIAEPVMGAGGMIVPPASFWPRVRAVCDRFGVLLIADEVVTGYGRTGFECGSRAWGVKPDIICTAKAITCGYFPFGATMVNGRIASAFEGTDALAAMITHGYTYSGHPVGCAAALAALSMTRSMKIWENAGVRGVQLAKGLQNLQQKHALVGDVRAKGLMAGVEIVTDRSTKQPADKKLMNAVAANAAASGVMIRTMENTIILSPPLIVAEEHVDQILHALDGALAAAAS